MTTPAITINTIGTLRSDAIGGAGIGCTIFTAAAPVTVYSLARWVVPGNAGTCTLQILDAGGGVVASATLSSAGKPSNALAWVDLATPVVLAASSRYYVFFVDPSSGDRWTEDVSTSVSVGDARITNVDSSYAVGVLNGANTCYGPVNLSFSPPGAPLLLLRRRRSA